MVGRLSQHWTAVCLVLVATIACGCVHRPPEREPTIDFLPIDDDITLRRSVRRNAHPAGTVLLLHGFPETVHAWDEVAPLLAARYEVHAFDWPGYGLSSRPPADRFSYAPRDYARVLGDYIRTAGIDSATLTIYATDIGALPALLLALEEPAVARTVIVGDFAPFDRPAYMYPSLQALKSPPASEQVRAQLNQNRDEILANTFTRGLPEDARFAITPQFRQDLATGWNHGTMTSADAFFHYYAHFTRDQDYLEANLPRLATPVKVVWGERDLYIAKEMGVEFATKAGAELEILPGIGHYPHLQDPRHVVTVVDASFGR